MGLFGLFGKKENEDPSVSLPMTEKEKFVVGTYALWSEYCGGSAQYIGGYVKNRSNASMVRGVLNRDWMVNNKDSGVDMVNYILDHAGEDEAAQKKLAFDCASACNMCGRMYIGGYLTREEAMELALKAAREIQKHYNSWEEYYQAYIEGTTSGSNVQDSIAKFQPILEKVRGMADGPFSVDWNTAL